MTTTIEICIKWHTTFYLCFQILKWKKPFLLFITLPLSHYLLVPANAISNFQMLNARARYECLSSLVYIIPDSFVCVYCIFTLYCAPFMYVEWFIQKWNGKKLFVKLWQRIIIINEEIHVCLRSLRAFAFFFFVLSAWIPVPYVHFISHV